MWIGMITWGIYHFASAVVTIVIIITMIVGFVAIVIVAFAAIRIVRLLFMVVHFGTTGLLIEDAMTCWMNLFIFPFIFCDILLDHSGSCYLASHDCVS